MASLLARAFLLTTALTVAWALPSAASAQATVTRARVRAMLQGIEDVPRDADWQRLGDAALPLLIELYTDRDEEPFVRLRAVAATAAFPRPATRTFLLAVARAERQGDLLVREAVLALARGFGREAVRDVGAFLGHREEAIREGAALALVRVGGPEARRLLQQRLPLERDLAVREVIQRGLR